jgi:hypothetical protein
MNVLDCICTHNPYKPILPASTWMLLQESVYSIFSSQRLLRPSSTRGETSVTVERPQLWEPIAMQIGTMPIQQPWRRLESFSWFITLQVSSWVNRIHGDIIDTSTIHRKDTTYGVRTKDLVQKSYRYRFLRICVIPCRLKFCRKRCAHPIGSFSCQFGLQTHLCVLRYCIFIHQS